MRREAGRAFLWLAVVLGGVVSAFAAVGGFWMLLAPFFETHRSLVSVGLAGILLVAAAVWAGTGVVTLAEILRETGRARTREASSAPDERP
jgi:hypothetical protein